MEYIKDMNIDELIDHYQENMKDILKIKNWKIFIQIMYDRLKDSPIPDLDPKPDPIILDPPIALH